MNTAKKPILVAKNEAGRTQSVVLPGASPTASRASVSPRTATPPTSRPKSFVSITPRTESVRSSRNSSRTEKEKKNEKQRHPPPKSKSKVMLIVIGAMILIFTVILIASSSRQPQQVQRRAPVFQEATIPAPQFGEWGEKLKKEGDSQELKERKARMRNAKP